MKVSYLVEPGLIELRELPLPEPGPGEILVRVKAALTCGTDLKAFLRGHPLIPMPGPFGHEFSGTVEAAGKDVTSFREGDAIMSVHTAPCGVCPYCRKGVYNLCDLLMETKILGAFAEYILVPASIAAMNAFPKPGELPFGEAAFLEPLSCVVHGQDGLNVGSDSAIAVIGTGPIGLLHLMLAKQKGAKVVITGLEPERLRKASELGADAAVAPGELEAAISDATEGLGVDAVIECTGQVPVWESAANYVRKGGTVILFGGCKQGTTVSYETYRLHYDEITLKGIFHYNPADVKKAYSLLADGSLKMTPLITDSYPLADLSVPFKHLAAGNGIKYAIIP